MGRKKLQIDFSKVVRLIDKGYTQIQIGKELGVGKNTIISYLKENNLTTKPRYEDLVSLRFGKLVVLERVENSKDRRRRYLCKCDCGRNIIVKSSYRYQANKLNIEIEAYFANMLYIKNK